MNKMKLLICMLGLAINSYTVAAEIDTESYLCDSIIVRSTDKERVNEELLEAAAVYDWVGVLSALKRGADSNCKDAEGNTPLIHACRYPKKVEFLRARVEIINMLLDEEADSEMKNSNGESALSIVYANSAYEDPEVLDIMGLRFSCCTIL